MKAACAECGQRSGTRRADARFCSSRCRARWHNRERRKRSSTAKRITSASGAEGKPRGHQGQRPATRYAIARVVSREPLMLVVERSVEANKRAQALRFAGADPTTHIAVAARDLA